MGIGTTKKLPAPNPYINQPQFTAEADHYAKRAKREREEREAIARLNKE